MTAEERYPVLVGHSAGESRKLSGIRQVAEFICIQGMYGDLAITKEDGTPFLTTFGIYIDRIFDMEYREELLKVLVPMQMELDGTEGMEEEQEMEMSGS